eukprot:375065_1
MVNPRCYRVLDLGDGKTKQISTDRLSKILDTSIITSLQSQHPDCNNQESHVAVTINQTNTVNNKKGVDTMQDTTNCFNLNRMVVWVLITMAWTANGLVLAGLSLNASNELFDFHDMYQAEECVSQNLPTSLDKPFRWLVIIIIILGTILFLVGC